MNELITYVPSPGHDVLMMQLWGKLVTTGDIVHVIPGEAYHLSGFFDYVRKAHVVFKCDGTGIWFMATYTAMLNGAQFDLWVDKDRRKGKLWNEAMCEALEHGFTKWPTLLGLTPHDILLASHVRMGYKIIGKIEKFWDGERDMHILAITKDSFDARETHMVRRASSGKG